MRDLTPSQKGAIAEAAITAAAIELGLTDPDGYTA
jgi:hypothetical protein